jgi:hypothetical protein
MKQVFFLFPLLTAFALLCHSQVKFIPTAGINFASSRFTNGTGTGKIPTELTNTYASRTGSMIGFSFEIPLSRKAFFCPGLFYLNIGHKASLRYLEIKNGVTVSVIGKQEVSLNYLHMPFNFGFNIPAGELVTIQIIAGPYCSFFLNGKDKSDVSAYANSTNYYNVSENNDMKPGKDPQNSGGTEYLNPLDLGINAGISLMMEKKFSIGINYLIGFSNIVPFYKVEPAGYSRSESASLRNSVISIRLGYSFFKEKV